MPETARNEISAVHDRLNEGARLWLWSLLFCVWAIFTWWALGVALLGMIVAYRTALAEAAVYGRLVQTCYDLYRKELYATLGRTFPEDARQEILAGRRLTAYLERGPLLEPATEEPRTEDTTNL